VRAQVAGTPGNAAQTCAQTEYAKGVAEATSVARATLAPGRGCPRDKPTPTARQTRTASTRVTNLSESTMELTARNNFPRTELALSKVIKPRTLQHHFLADGRSGIAYDTSIKLRFGAGGVYFIFNSTFRRLLTGSWRGVPVTLLSLSKIDACMPSAQVFPFTGRE